MKTKRFLFYVNSVDFFVSHRLKLIGVLESLGFEVCLAAPVGVQGVCIGNIPSSVKRYDILYQRHSKSLLSIIRELRAYKEMVRSVRPDVIQAITLKASFLACLYNLSNVFRPDRVYLICAFTGLGQLFTRPNSVKMRIISFLLKIFFRTTFFLGRTHYVFQNDDDPGELLIKCISDRCSIIKGMGVNTDGYRVGEVNPNRIRLLFASRLIYTKGILDFLRLADKINRKFGHKISIAIAGGCDQASEDRISEKVLRDIEESRYIKYHGHVHHVDSLLFQSDILVFTSYREGFPLMVMQASAAGVVTVAYNVPGCRDAVCIGRNGILVPLGDVCAIEAQIESFVTNPKRLVDMKLRARAYAEEHFEEEVILAQYRDLYKAVRAML
jgi:glycosyltransferase involved in cell wall biosynthesis